MTAVSTIPLNKTNQQISAVFIGGSSFIRLCHEIGFKVDSLGATAALARFLKNFLKERFDHLDRGDDGRLHLFAQSQRASLGFEKSGLAAHHA